MNHAAIFLLLNTNLEATKTKGVMMSKEIMESEVLQAIEDGNRLFAEIMTTMTGKGYRLANSTLSHYLTVLKDKRKIHGSEFNMNGKRYRKWSRTDAVPKDAVPNLPEPLLNMMGYTSQVPTGGRFINNENLQITYHVSKVKVYPGTSYGNVALRMP